MKIVDAHTHVASEECFPPSFIDGMVANLACALAGRGIAVPASALRRRFEPYLQDPLADKLVQEMDEAGIDHAVLLVPDFTIALDDCVVSIEEAFDRHHEILARHPGRFTVFGGVDPRWGADGVALFERSLDAFGFGGFKIYPPCGYGASDPELYPYYELCAHHRVPVVVHVGPTSPALSFTNTNPFQLDRAAQAFPTVNFILAHGCANFVEECLMMCRFRPNVHLDISGYQSVGPAGGPGDAIGRTVDKGINHKVLYGTDWPVFRMQGDLRTFVEEVVADDGPLSEIPDHDRELILHGNIERLLAERRPVAAAGHHHSEQAR